MAFSDTIQLVSGRSLIMGNAPSNKIKMAQIANKMAKQKRTRKDVQSFGLFDNNTSNYNTYYPDVTEKDLQPQKGEFIEPVFRSLSKVVVHKEYNPVDFGHGNVLKRSMPLLMAQSIYTDHEDAVGNALGAISEVSWQDGYKTKGGILIPAGINSRLKIDGKSHPRIARAIMMDPPAIHSTSVTVNFLWEKSHPSMADDNFWKNLGAYDEEGKLITRVATKINRYHEISLVSHGADPFAQLIGKGGEITNPTYASISYNSLSGKRKQKQKYFMFSLNEDVVKNSTKTIPNKPIISTKETPTVMKKDPKKSAKKKAEVKNTPKKSNTKLVKQLASLKQRDKLQLKKIAKLEKANGELGKYKERYEKLKSKNEKALKKLREEVLRNYSLLAKDSPDREIISAIKGADAKSLKAMGKEYQRQLEEKYPSSCADCGSDNITKASAHIHEQNASTLVEDIEESLESDIAEDMVEKMH